MADEHRQPADDQRLLRAMGNPVRHRMFGLLADGPATITQLAARLDVLKGSAAYHARILEEAGVIEVVRTRKVRGVTERYYDRRAAKVALPPPVAGGPDVLMRNALADLEAAPADDQRMVLLRHVRVSPEIYDEFAERLEALATELAGRSTSDAPAADLAIAFYRPHRPPPEPTGDA